jgi:hypothetical protein
MSQDDLDTIEVLDDEEFLEEVQAITIDEPEKIIISKKAKRGSRRLIDDVLEDRRLNEVLKGFEDFFQANDGLLDTSVMD